MTQYNVTGMSCAACVARVEKAVNQVPGVSSCAVSLLTNSMGVDGTALATVISQGVSGVICFFYMKKRFTVLQMSREERRPDGAKMKRLCAAANVESHKVYPHNLRKLFARTFYTMEKDIALLADILGHGSIETTRIYIMSTGKEHRQKIEHLNLLM